MSSSPSSPMALHGSRPATTPPKVGAACSLLVPVYNEATIVEDSIARMLAAFTRAGVEYEIVVCENGSTDATLQIVQTLQRHHPEVRLEHLPTPNYGLALKHGIRVCRYEAVVLVNADFWDMAFVREALARLEDYDLIIGSKVMRGSRDLRPILRRMITRSFNGFLRMGFGFAGTDTHGMKAFRRCALADIVEQCVTDHFIFDTELVLRAQGAGLRVLEVPVKIRELRQPSYRSLLKRFPRVLWNLLKLWQALHRGEA